MHARLLGPQERLEQRSMQVPLQLMAVLGQRMHHRPAQPAAVVCGRRHAAWAIAGPARHAVPPGKGVCAAQTCTALSVPAAAAISACCARLQTECSSSNADKTLSRHAAAFAADACT